MRKKKFVKLPNRISPLANWTFYCGKGLASSRSIRYNVIDEVSFPLWRYTWKRTKKVTALYCRLSKDDGSNSESLSIRTQKAMLMEYATRNGFGNCQYYVDDGYSGTNSDRPAFQELLDDIREGKVATVITKDQSRLGRNHIETGTYMEIFFPEHGVRYIAINDG